MGLKKITIRKVLEYLLLTDNKLFYWIPDKVYLSLEYWIVMGKRLNLKSPRTYNEKIQWLKLYNRDPEYSKLVDKYEVKKYIKERIGEEYIIPTIGVWNDVDEIDFESLPESFVLKCTHDSGGVVICRDKKQLDIGVAKKTLRDSMNTNFYKLHREWPYKGVKPRIIAEEYLCDNIQNKSKDLTDYKFFCVDGVVDNVMVCMDRSSGDTKFYFFDKNWNLKRLNKRGKEAPEGFTIPKPELMDKMFELASQLSKGFPFVRVDLYESNHNIFFGEMTFFPDSGFDANLLPETNEYFGSLIDLSGIDIEKRNKIT